MISPLAHVHPNSKIGVNTIVEPFAYIQEDVIIGDNCHIHPHTSILDGARIGNNCAIHSGAIIAGTPQDLKFKGEKTTVTIGNNTTIRECVTINRGTAARGDTTIGENTLIMAYTHVGHDCVVGNNCILVNRVSLAGEVEVHDFAIIGGHVAVHQFSKIGTHSMISGGTLVNKDVPPYVKCAHTPIAFVGLNTVGLRRRAFTSEQILEIQHIAKILFQSSLNYKAGCEKVLEDVPQSHFRDEIVNFITNSKRGILKPYQTKSSNDDID